jgi:hypothetical protein
VVPSFGVIPDPSGLEPQYQKPAFGVKSPTTNNDNPVSPALCSRFWSQSGRCRLA